LLFQTYTLVVKAIADGVDGGNDRSSEATVTIELSDVNHYTPQFTHRVKREINNNTPLYRLLHSRLIRAHPRAQYIFYHTLTLCAP